MFRLTGLALRNLRSRTLRTLLTLLAVALGVGLVFGTQLTAGALARRSLQVAEEQFGSADLTVKAFAKQGFSADMVTAIAKLPSVRATSSQLSKQTAATIGASRSFVLVEGIDTQTESRFHSLSLASGRWFRNGHPFEVVLAQPFAQQHGLRPGDHLQLVTISGFDVFDVVGVVAPGGLGELNAGQAVFVSLDAARQLFALGGRVQQVEVALEPGRSAADFRSELAPVATQDYYVFDRSSITSDPGLLLSGLTPLAVGLGLLSLFVAMLLVANTLTMEVLDRRRAIGVLRAAGATGGQVGAIFVVQGALLGVAGGLLGLLFGLALAEIAGTSLASAAGLGSLPIAIDPLLLVLIFLGGVLLTLLAAALAVRRATRLAPLEALRPGFALEAPRPPLRLTLLGLLALVVGVLLVAGGQLPPLQVLGSALIVVASGLLLPLYLGPLVRAASLPVRAYAGAEGLLAGRSLLRRRTRTGLTVGGLGFATAAVIALAGLSQSAEAQSHQWLGSLFVSRELVVSPLDQPLSVANSFTALPGVLAASPISSFSVRSGDTALPAVAIEPFDYATGGGLALQAGDSRTALSGLSGDRMLLPYVLAQQLGATVGSNLPLSTEEGVVPFTVSGILYHSLPGSTGQESAVFSQSTAARRFGVDFFDVLQIVPAGGSLDLAAVRQQALSYGMDLVSVDQISTAVDSGVSGLILVLQAAGSVAIAVALLGIINTMLVSVAEGRRELALLRSIGMTRGQLSRLVISEAVTLSLAGAALGAVVGTLGLIGLLRATSTASFQPVVVVPWIAAAEAAAGLILAAVLAALVPARQAAGGSIVEALRVET